MDGRLALADLAARTGVSETSLRTWNHRFGFPEGHRDGSGRRWFDEEDVHVVAEVLSAREAGLPLRVAVRSVGDGRRRSRPTTVHGALVETFGDLRRHRLSRRAMLACSRAIEDESLARGRRPVVLGSFQHARRFWESAHRWEEIARTAGYCAALADFDSDAARPPATRGDVVLAPQPDRAPMLREWTVVYVDELDGGVLSGWQVPGEGAELYEAIVSSRPAVALAAAKVLIGLVESSGVSVPSSVLSRLERFAPARASDPDALLGRMVDYLGREVGA